MHTANKAHLLYKATCCLEHQGISPNTTYQSQQVFKFMLQKKASNVLMHKKVLSHASHSFRMKLKPALLEYPGTRFLWRDQTLLLSSDKLLPLCMTMTNLSTYSSQQKLACCVLGKSHEYLLSHQNACKLLVLGNKYIAFLLRPLLQCSYNMMGFEN